MSRSNYIIICDIRIEVLAAKDPVAALVRVSNGAAALVKQLEIIHGEEFTEADARPVSELQHEIMVNLHSWSKSDAEGKARDMLSLLDALEEKFD